MAGHSQFKNIMHRKGAQDAKRAKMFNKVIRELNAAVKSGGIDPESNPRLRAALSAARSVNMPKDNIDRALKKAAGGEDSADYVEIRYEGYGPGGVAIIVDTLTDNRNRTAADVRSAFNKYGGSLGETNSVSFQFDRVGFIYYPQTIGDHDKVFENALEAGARDISSDEEGHEIICAFEDFNAVRDHLTSVFGDPERAQVLWKPHVSVPISGDSAKTLLKLIDALEDFDDVQTVCGNYEFDEETLMALNT
jgi:YebC/PmpR family DNA-binding regulatory protein